MSDPGSIRHLDRLEEDDEPRSIPRGVTMALVVLGGACVVFAGLALGGRTAQPPAAKSDPLGDLEGDRWGRCARVAAARAIGRFARIRSRPC